MIEQVSIQSWSRHALRDDMSQLSLSSPLSGAKYEQQQPGDDPRGPGGRTVKRHHLPLQLQSLRGWGVAVSEGNRFFVCRASSYLHYWDQNF